MRALFMTTLLTLTASVFTMQASAGECVPTKSVEQAQGDLKSEIASLDLWLKNSYAAATAEHDKSIGLSMNQYQNSIDKAREVYTIKMNAISAEFANDWRAKMDAATAEFNAATSAALSNYNASTDAARAVYTEKVNAAQTSYNSGARAAADRYNQSVCAKP